MSLNAKRRAFVREYGVDKNATQSAIRAGYSKQTAYAQGSRLLKDVEVIEALQRNEAEHIKRCAYDRDRINNQYQSAFDLAQMKENCGVMVQATTGLAKVNGHMNEGATVNVNVGLGGLLKDLEDRRIKDITPTPLKLDAQDVLLPIKDATVQKT